MIKKWIEKGLNPIYLNNFIRGVAFALFGIFVPIYFLTLGYSLETIATYFLIFQVFTFLFIFMGYNFAKKFGYKALMIINVPAVIIFITLLNLLDSYNIPLSLIALMNGIQNACFFLPLHGFFSRLSGEGKRGGQVSKFSISGKLASLFGPLVGAVIITILGFKYLFVTATIVMLVSVTPVLLMKNVKPKEKITVKRMKELSKQNKGFFGGLISEKVLGEVSGTIWPIFAFLILKDIFSVGWIGFFITGGAIIFTLIIGRHYDKKSKYIFLRIGGILFAMLWALRFFVDSSLFIFSSSFIAGFLGLMITLPFNAMFYDKSSKENPPDSFIIFTEIPGHVGKILIWLLVLLAISNLKISFIVAAIASLTLVFLKFGVYKKGDY